MRIKRKQITLRKYVLRRTGVPLGSSGSLRRMFGRSFNAASPREFWKYWNPIFGYYLGKHIYAPLKRVFPASLALIVTFLFSGLIHDVATILVKSSTRFLFTTWFLFLGLGVLGGGMLNVDLSKQGKPTRVIFNLMYLFLSFALAYSLLFKLSSM